MTTKQEPAEQATTPAALPQTTPPQIHFLTPSAREGAKLYKREIATYVREVPRLLKERQKGKYALITDDEILSIWDTYGDAMQAGCERFGLDPIFVVPITPRYL